MSELIPTNVPTREQIARLQETMAVMPQIEIPTEHYFSDNGMYCRKMTCKAGQLIVGKIHKHDHFFICALGEMIVWTETGMRELKAGDVVESKPGTKRVILCKTDAIGMNVHKTDKRDLDEIEAELIEPEEGPVLFDSGNKLIKIEQTRIEE